MPEPTTPKQEPKKQPISWQRVLEASGTGRHASPFVLPQPMPGVLPRGAPTMAMDDGTVPAFAFANGFGMFEGIVWPGFTYLAELAQRPEYRRISDVFAKEMTRKWITIQSRGDDDKSDKIKQIEAAFDRLRVQQVFAEAALHDGLFGRGQIYIDTGKDDRDELLTALVPNRTKMGRGGLKGLRTIEPMWTYPGQYNARDPMRADFYKPQSWYVMGKEIHATRLLTFIGREMPDLLKPAYMFSGLSRSQMAKPYVDNWLRTRQSVSDLLHSFSCFGLKTDMNAAVAGSANGPDLIARMQFFNLTRDNRGLMMLNKETEEFFNVSAPLGTLDKLLAQSQEQVCSVAGTPLVIYTGITPSGLNASSDGEIRVFYDGVGADQNHMFRDHLETVLRFVQLSEFGEIDEEIGFRFNPLWQSNEIERAQVRKTDADAAVELIGAGVLSPDDERQRLASSEDSLYHGLDLNAPMADAGELGEMGLSGDPDDDDDAGTAARLAAG